MRIIQYCTVFRHLKYHSTRLKYRKSNSNVDSSLKIFSKINFRLINGYNICVILMTISESFFRTYDIDNKR